MGFGGSIQVGGDRCTGFRMAREVDGRVFLWGGIGKKGWGIRLL